MTDEFKQYAEFVKKYDNLFGKKTSILTLEKENQKSNEDLLKRYDKILLQTIILSKELKINNPLELSMMYTYLLWSGYFSKDKKLVYESNMRKQILGLYPLSIMDGYGVCLNFSYMLNDLLQKRKFESARLIGKIKHLNISYRPNINRIITNQTLITKIYNKVSNHSNSLPNHAFNFIKENNKYYIYDPTNICLFNVENIDKIRPLYGNSSIEIEPDIRSCIDTYNFRMGRQAFNFPKDINFKAAYSEEEYHNLWESTMELINQNKRMLNDYYDTTKEDIYYIAKNLRKTK